MAKLRSAPTRPGLASLLLCVAAGVLAAGLTFCAVSGFIQKDYMSEWLDDRIRSLNAVSAEAGRTFRRLQTQNARPCSREHEYFAKSLLASADLIVDIIYADDTAFCSALGLPFNSFADLKLGKGTELNGGLWVFRQVHLPNAPNIPFVVLSNGPNYLLVHAVSSFELPPERRLTLSRVDVNHETGHAELVQGPDLGIPASKLHGSAMFWRPDRFVMLSCVASQQHCLQLSARWSDLLRPRPASAGISAIFGLLVGCTTSVAIAAWRDRRVSLPGRLKQALRRNEFYLLYQPIVDAQSRQAIAAEALIRWTTSAGEVIDPGEFIPVAEESGMISDITCAVIKMVLRDLGAFLRAHRGFSVSINIVAEDLSNPVVVSLLRRQIAENDIDPGQIALELTERTSVQSAIAIQTINELRHAGLKIYIDDFGTGFSSLSYLGELNVDAIKLDRSFTRSIGTEAVRARLVPLILDILRETGVPTVVEGVETEAQVAFFLEHGIRVMQGFLFSRPQQVSELMVAVAESRSYPTC